MKFSKICSTHDLRKINVRRSSVIPYIIINDSIYFLFGIDTDSGDITDFGGGCKSNEFALYGGLREFEEESNGIFGPVYDEIKKSNYVALKDRNMATIFVPLEKEWLHTAKKIFENERKNTKTKCRLEIKELLWLSEEHLENMLIDPTSHDYKLWTKLRRYYKQTINHQLKLKLKDIYKTYADEKK